VASVAQLAPIHLGVDVHKDTVSVGNLDADQQVRDVEGSLTRRCRSAGSSAAWLIPAGYEPATRPGRPACSFGDTTSTAGSAARVSHTYGQAGTYLVTLGITHDSGNSASAVNSVTATNSARFVRSRSARGLSQRTRVQAFADAQSAPHRAPASVRSSSHAPAIAFHGGCCVKQVAVRRV
jgi:hypothetical protein